MSGAGGHRRREAEPCPSPGVAAVSEPAQNEAGDITVVQVTPKSGPAADETKDLVSYRRSS